jgi:hypothetical protein
MDGADPAGGGVRGMTPRGRKSGKDLAFREYCSSHGTMHIGRIPKEISGFFEEFGR